MQWREITAPGLRVPLAAACLGVWLHAADGLLVSTMTPAIVADIGGVALVPWTFALYEMGTIVVGAAGGLLSMRFGIRLPMALAGALFALGCAVSALAPAMEVLLLGRIFQGLGGGGLMALSFVLTAVRFPPRLVPRVMAAISTIWGVSAFTGPLIGGLFVEFSNWRNGFWFFALQALALAAWMFLQKDKGDGPKAAEHERFPLQRLMWLCAGVVLVAYGGIDVAPLGTTVFVLLGLLCLALFVRLDAGHTESRLLPPRPLSLFDPIGAAIVMIICFAAATTAVTIYVPLLITSLHGVSVLVAGYVIALESIAWTVAALLVSGQPPSRDRMFILTGMTIITVGTAGLIYAVPQGPVWLVAVFASMLGFGFGTAWTFILRLATGIAPQEETRRVSSALPTVHRLGFALGAAFIGIVANASGIDDPARLKFVAAAVFIASLPLALLGLFAATRFVAGTRA
ncbi:MFS transporter [Nitratireductor sp. XY-223]|uniref:MFS transporter n=1 Tax=Nitratireductor sp. XY-223 TaxID=2561926 RepID=UPI0010A9B4C1|nr:MFS transporter [Nitratireductor sp. XY-223]